MNPLTPDQLHGIHAYRSAANFPSVGQIYLLENPLLRRPLTLADIKPRLLGHWGTTPGLNFIYAHLNRVIKAHDLNALYITGPGHGGPGLVANPRKLALAKLLWTRTTVSQDGIAEKLSMRSAANVSQQLRRMSRKGNARQLPPEPVRFLENP